MSRAFTSEEYEQKDVQIVAPKKKETTPDEELVFQYSKGRDLNDPSLPYEIGIRFMDGTDGFFQDDGLTVKWLDRAVRMGSDEAMVALADFFLRDTKTNGYRKSAKLLRMAADRGNEDAIARLDMENIDSPTSKRTYEAYRFNAELGDAKAMRLLAEGFEKGNFGKDKSKAAAVWYTKAFKHGDDDAAKRVLALYYKKKIELTPEELAFLRSKGE